MTLLTARGLYDRRNPPILLKLAMRLSLKSASHVKELRLENAGELLEVVDVNGVAEAIGNLKLTVAKQSVRQSRKEDDRRRALTKKIDEIPRDISWDSEYHPTR